MVLQYSLRSIGLVFALIGFACVALHNADWAWAAASLSITTTILLIAVVVGLHSRGADRAFYQGMCIFGWSYFLMMYLPERPENIGATPVSSVEQALLAFRPVFEREIPLVQDANGTFPGKPFGSGVWGDPLAGYYYTMPISAYYMVVGHATCTLLCASFGGFLCRACYIASVRSSKGDDETRKSGYLTR